jgi:hypothetical protein
MIITWLLTGIIVSVAALDPPAVGGCGKREWQLEWAARQHEQATLLSRIATALDLDPERVLPDADCPRLASARVVIWRCREQDDCGGLGTVIVCLQLSLRC